VPAPRRTLLAASITLGVGALSILPVNTLLFLTTKPAAPHAMDGWCMALAAAQAVIGLAGGIGMLIERARSAGLLQRGVMLAAALLFWMVAAGGLLGLALVYVTSLDQAGVGARFN
jgi:hypothetical protein